MAAGRTEKLRIGILFTGDYSWAGGIYYSLTAIKLLQQISLTHPLELIVFVNKFTGPELLDEIKLPNVTVVNLNAKKLFYKIYCRIIGRLTSSNFRFIKDINSERLDILFPVIKYERSHKHLNCKIYYWIYDFQHKFLPELFPAQEIKERDQNFLQLVNHAQHIVVSSEDSKNHLQRFYPQYKKNIHVYSFVSVLPENGADSAHDVAQFEEYFIVCNQFWPHKNHLVVLKALKDLMVQHDQTRLIFTGKFDLEKNKKYVDELQNYISENNLASFIHFTGFLPRESQVALIRKAKAVIQPSRFEGWSTVIEDAKALHKKVIASDLPIHNEQLGKNALYFGVDDHQQLAAHIKAVSDDTMVTTIVDYDRQIKSSKENLMKIFGIS